MKRFFHVLFAIVANMICGNLKPASAKVRSRTLKKCHERDRIQIKKTDRTIIKNIFFEEVEDNELFFMEDGVIKSIDFNQIAELKVVDYTLPSPVSIETPTSVVSPSIEDISNPKEKNSENSESFVISLSTPLLLKNQSVDITDNMQTAVVSDESTEVRSTTPVMEEVKAPQPAEPIPEVSTTTVPVVPVASRELTADDFDIFNSEPRIPIPEPEFSILGISPMDRKGMNKCRNKYSDAIKQGQTRDKFPQVAMELADLGKGGTVGFFLDAAIVNLKIGVSTDLSQTLRTKHISKALSQLEYFNDTPHRTILRNAQRIAARCYAELGKWEECANSLIHALALDPVDDCPDRLLLRWLGQSLSFLEDRLINGLFTILEDNILESNDIPLAKRVIAFA